MHFLLIEKAHRLLKDDNSKSHSMGRVNFSLSDPDEVPYDVVTCKLIETFSNRLALLFLVCMLE